MRTIFVVWFGGLVGCSSYHPGSFTALARTFREERLTIGCLDVAVDRRADKFESAIVDYRFGNRCDRPVVVDLGRVPVRGRTVTGDEVALAPYDPHGVIGPRQLDARAAGGEALAYPSAVALAQICVDAAAIGAPTADARWLCFAQREVP